MRFEKWHVRWTQAHPHATLSEYSEALCRHTLLTSIITYVVGTVTFIATACASTLLQKQEALRCITFYSIMTKVRSEMSYSCSYSQSFVQDQEFSFVSLRQIPQAIGSFPMLRLKYLVSSVLLPEPCLYLGSFIGYLKMIKTQRFNFTILIPQQLAICYS